jgi:hypothetical protein
MPPATAIVTATSLVALTEERAVQAKKALKQTKTRYKAAKKAMKKARKASRQAAKLARKARRRFNKLQSQIAKARKTAPARKPEAKAKTRPPLNPARPLELAAASPQPAIHSSAV